MNNWMLRGLVYAGAMVVVRLVQGTLINAFQTQAGLISLVLLLLFIIGVVVWGFLDGRADARANPDPDRRQDLAMTWLLAGLVAGLLSGAVSWLLALFYKGLYTGGLLNEITTFAAFTALLVFLPAIIGVTLGRWRVDRNPEAHRAAESSGERADTDVFSAVRGDETPTGEIPAGAGGARHEERTSAVATVEGGGERQAERDAPTETIPTTRPTSEARTETIPTGDDDAKTEVIRTDTEAGHSGSEPEKG
ncbi:MAG: B-4DMT family transporter [Mycobacterium sp.]|uniref:B-4DMT family transporter n=1 Tax=Mycobacterium sp. TaxID=1785 RepID=UPI003F968E19